MSVPADQPTDVSTLALTDLTTLRRKKERASYDRSLVHDILDEGLLCHVGFSAEGSTFVVPMVHARIGDSLYLHGATGNRMLRHLAQGAEVCVSVTLLDAIVLARSALHQSMNFRSVMLFGTTTRVDRNDEKQRVTTALLEQIVPGRSAHARPPTAEELRAVLMLRLPIDEGSAKVRTGGPIDEPDDLGLAIWAGHIPLSIVAGAAVPDGVLPSSVHEPSYVRSYPARGSGIRADAAVRSRRTDAPQGG